MWALAVWEAWVPIALLDKLIHRTCRRLDTAKHVWSIVYGPAAALIATLRRLQWVVHSACKLTTDEGVSVDLKLDSPAYIKGVVSRSVERWRWRNVESRHPALSSNGRGAGAWWKPIQA
eukprot:5468646-Karenia_brevis.AAC.1